MADSDAGRRLDIARARAARSARSVAQQIDRSTDHVPWDFRVAVVVDTAPLSIEYADAVTIADVGRLAHYTPVVFDTVLVLVRAPVATIIGKFP